MLLQHSSANISATLELQLHVVPQISWEETGMSLDLEGMYTDWLIAKVSEPFAPLDSSLLSRALRDA